LQRILLLTLPRLALLWNLQRRITIGATPPAVGDSQDTGDVSLADHVIWNTSTPPRLRRGQNP
jgi:hypothetical protein